MPLKVHRFRRRKAAARGVVLSVVLKPTAVSCQGTRDKFLLHRARLNNLCDAVAVQLRTVPRFDRAITSLLGVPYLVGEPLAIGNYLVGALCFFSSFCQSGMVVVCWSPGELSRVGEAWGRLCPDCRCLGWWFF